MFQFTGHYTLTSVLFCAISYSFNWTPSGNIYYSLAAMCYILALVVLYFSHLLSGMSGQFNHRPFLLSCGAVNSSVVWCSTANWQMKGNFSKKGLETLSPGQVQTSCFSPGKNSRYVEYTFHPSEWHTYTHKHTHTLEVFCYPRPLTLQSACGGLYSSPQTVSSVKAPHGRHSSGHQSETWSSQIHHPETWSVSFD